MGARAEGLPWERRPREGEHAYAAFLAYRDLGPGRTHEAMRVHLGEQPGSIKPIERWSASWDWRRRVGAWDARRRRGADPAARRLHENPRSCPGHRPESPSAT